MVSQEYIEKEKRAQKLIRRMLTVFIIGIVLAAYFQYFTGAHKYVSYAFFLIAGLAIVAVAVVHISLSGSLLEEYEKETERIVEEFDTEREGK